MAKASSIVATVLREIMELVEPGQTTGDLDAHAERRIREMGATPSFHGLPRLPSQHLRQHQQRGGARHPQQQACDPCWRSTQSGYGGLFRRLPRR